MDELVPEPYSPAPRLLRESWGLIAERVTPLPGEYDANFRVRAAGGRGSFVLKVMHSSRDRAFLDLQVALLRHVAAAAPSLCVSRVVPSLSGAPLVDAGGGRLAWLLEWIPGKPLARAAPQGPHLLAQLGGVMGRLARARQGPKESRAGRSACLPGSRCRTRTISGSAPVGLSADDARGCRQATTRDRQTTCNAKRTATRAARQRAAGQRCTVPPGL